MKKKLDKSLRASIIGILIIGILIIGYFIFHIVSNPDFEDREVHLFTYQNIGNINYKVFLKENNLYDENTIGEGDLYITEFVDYIKANFKYEYKSDDISDIKINYSIGAKVQGFTEEKDQEVIIWEKVFPIIPEKENIISEKSIFIDEEIKIYLNEYSNFAIEIIDASKIRSKARLLISMDVNIFGKNEKGDFNEEFSPNLIIPLDSPMFQIRGNSAINKHGSIVDKVKIRLPINKKDLIFNGTILGVLISILLGVLIFTAPISKKDPIEKTINRIFKKHGDRLVALNTEMENKNGKIVRTIEDLVRVADEIDKPILYKYNEDYKEIKHFYVVSDREVYILEIGS